MKTIMLRRAEVLARTGLARSTIYKLMAQGDFPKPVKLTGKAIAWPENVIEEWLASRQVAA